MVQDTSIKLCDIVNVGQIYDTYGDFFKENNLDDTGYISYWQPTDYYDWRIIFKGKHSQYDRILFVLEKKISNKIRKIIIESDGVGNIRFTKKFNNSLIYNNIWQEV